MKIKDKAEQLVNKYRCILMAEDTDCGEEILCTTIAKRCALIAVDEILKCPETFQYEQVKYSDGSYAREEYEVPNKYWTKVKDEIQKL